MCAFAKAQTPTVPSLLQEVQAQYSAKDTYSIATSYQLYKGVDGEEVKAAYKGITVVNNQDLYARIHNTEFFKIGKHTLKVNRDQKKGIYGGLAQQGNPLDVTQFLRAFKEYTVEEQVDTYICTLSSHAITQLPYGKVVIHIDKTTKEIRKQELYYLGSSNFGTLDKQKMDTPKLEIVFASLEQDITPYLPKFDLDNIISISKKGIIGRNEYTKFAISK